MELEERVASAIRAQTDLLTPTTPDVAVIRASAKTQGRRRTAIVVACAAAAVVAVFASGVTTDAGSKRSDSEPIGPPSPSPTASTATEPIDTSTWTTYTSDRYDLEVGHPPDWTVVPATRNWGPDSAQDGMSSAALESFDDPSGEVRVSVWQIPLEPIQRMESTAHIAAWAGDYCKATGTNPCNRIEERAVELCLEKRDCHPGLLVPFEDDVQAFITGGIYDDDAMTVVAVWRGVTDSNVTHFGGPQRLLEAFLSTMEVWPKSTPMEERR